MSRRQSVRPARRRRDRRYAVRLQNLERPELQEFLYRLRGPSSWRCKPHARPHPTREAIE
jgi:hypothetical protein